MPELPEVETVVRDLRPLIVDRQIERVECDGIPLRTEWCAAWSQSIAGMTVEEIGRRGKWIVVALSGGAKLVIHLGMTGQLTAISSPVAPDGHTHLRFMLAGGGELRFRDVRRFGSATLFETAEKLTAFLDARLGPEPFDLKPATWREVLSGSRRCLKAILLDQTIVAGVGNIYADESLFAARLHPNRRANELAKGEADRLRRSIVAVLNRAIEHRGSTIRDYIGGSGLQGGFQDEFAVYGRAGEMCRRCRGVIEVSRLAGRSSHFCPRCQPANGVRR